MADDDDDGESLYDKVPHSVKSRNFVLLLPGEKDPFTFPLGFGLNTLWDAGRTAAEIARRGGDRWLESAGNFASTVVDAFNPIGGTNSIANFVAPTFVDPFVDVMQNRDFFGSPIQPKENPFEPPVAPHRNHFSGVSPYAKQFTDILNAISGGDDVVPGALSVSPELVEHFLGFGTGGLGRFVGRTAAIPAKLNDPEAEITVEDFPVVRSLWHTKNKWYDKGQFYDRMDLVRQTVDRTRDYLDRGQFDSAADYARAKESLLMLEPAMKAAQKEMRTIGKARREIEGQMELGKIDRATYERERALIQKAEDIVVRRFNTEYVSTVLNRRKPDSGQ
jgi:hypothetical protein